MLACQHGNSDVIQLLSTTRMVGATDTRGCTALMECANAGFIRVQDFYLHMSVDTETRRA